MTELIWEGKYDKEGRRVASLRIALPFQTVETGAQPFQWRVGAGESHIVPPYWHMGAASSPNPIIRK